MFLLAVCRRPLSLIVTCIKSRLLCVKKMADDDVEDALTARETLAAKHKAEKKDLQAKIQSLKKGIPKGDKKRNKEVKAQIAVLENELDLKHEKELSELDNGALVEGSGFDSLNTQENGKSENSQPRISKAQKKREKKALKAKEQAEVLAKAEKDYVNTQRYEEEEEIRKLLAKMRLEVKTMVSDGNCLYYAIEDQLKSLPETIAMSFSELRKKASEYMLAHRDDFMPFLTNPDTGDCFTCEEFEKYCQDVSDTAAWGGQLELRALSHVLCSPIHVIQANVPTVKIGEEYSGKPIVLTYHRHELGLGEHYNSVKPLQEISNGDT